jgi:hypothetical protein
MRPLPGRIDLRRRYGEHQYRCSTAPRFALFLLCVAAATAILRWFWQRQLGPDFRFLFEDLPDPAVRTLNITH